MLSRSECGEADTHFIPYASRKVVPEQYLECHRRVAIPLWRGRNIKFDLKCGVNESGRQMNLQSALKSAVASDAVLEEWCN